MRVHFLSQKLLQNGGQSRHAVDPPHSLLSTGTWNRPTLEHVLTDQLRKVFASASRTPSRPTGFHKALCSLSLERPLLLESGKEVIRNYSEIWGLRLDNLGACRFLLSPTRSWLTHPRDS